MTESSSIIEKNNKTSLNQRVDNLIKLLYSTQVNVNVIPKVRHFSLNFFLLPAACHCITLKYVILHCIGLYWIGHELITFGNHYYHHLNLSIVTRFQYDNLYILNINNLLNKHVINDYYQLN